jgi:uridine monophosphate synthetase
VTVNPYLGQDSVTPFLIYPGKMVFVLCYTSNPSAREVQEFGSPEERLFEHIARQGQTWGSEEQIGFVIGSTQPHALARFRELNPDGGYWILAPGIGAQGGNLQAALSAGLDKDGRGIIVPVSRGVIYADDPRAAAIALRDEINQARQALKPTLRAGMGMPAYRGMAGMGMAGMGMAGMGMAGMGMAGMGMPAYREMLILQLYEVGCVQFGNFTLASGQQSPIYIDLRRISASPALLKMAARAYADLLRTLAFDHLAAVPYAALTIGTAVALETNKPLIYPRKEVKAHGMGKAIEGVFSAGEKAVVLEDLVTSGGSVIKAIETLESAGLIVSDVTVLIDREQGGRENLAERGYRLYAALKLPEILDTLYEAGRISVEQVTEVKRYLVEG